MNRRDLLRTMGWGAAAMAFGGPMALGATPKKRPNVLIILTDDQGYGDIGAHGNEWIDTPNLDRLWSQSTRMTRFYAEPVCAPARACLMTGRYNYRTGVTDTWMGRAMMDTRETTLAEAMRTAGYRTGIFGKWHLGDNYPMRPIDQGFDEAVVHRGGGIGQPSDPVGSSYFDPTLEHNGHPQLYEGYCTDIFAGEAIRFIRESGHEPFMAYLATNVPHSPHVIAEEYSRRFEGKGLNGETPQVYGMIKNLDENIGRVLGSLDEMGLADDTIVIFSSDNGPFMTPEGQRYNAGLRGEKGTSYEGGIREPFFIRWPGRLQAGSDIDRIAQLIDVMPTVLDACGVTPPKDVAFDGVSLMPLLMASTNTDWPDRTLHVQWHRGDRPEAFRNSASIGQRWKLVNGVELYDIENDPNEADDLAAQHPEIVTRLRAEYEAWLKDVCSTRGFDPPRIELGTPHEEPTVLTPQDWRGAENYMEGNLGYWEVRISQAGSYSFTLRTQRDHGPNAVLHLRIADVHLQTPLKKYGAYIYRFDEVDLPEGPARLEAWVSEEGKDTIGVRYAEVRCH